MALFKRRSTHTNELETPVGHDALAFNWTNRLRKVGDALDALHSLVEDVVVTADGGPSNSSATINLLGYRASSFHPGWTSVTYRLNRGDSELTETTGQLVLESLVGASANWGDRFAAVGHLIDGTRPNSQSVTLIVLDTGIVVNAVVPDESRAQRMRLQSFSFTNDQIRAAISESVHTQTARMQ